MQRAVIGIDVGTGSARAGVFDLDGRHLASASRPIQMWRPEPDWAEQSTDDIWQSIRAAVREALGAVGGELDVRGIGVDATCSLAAVDEAGRSATVSPTRDPQRNVIVWMDHRAIDQAERINKTGADVLRYVGGRISPEMETPKLLWLAETMPDAFANARHFFDLSDFLTWRMTGDETRSLCTTVSKWTFLGHEDRWDESYFRQIGLGMLADERFRRIGTRVRPLGEAVGQGLSAEAAADLGLPPGIPVSTAAIDAHAGGIGTIGTSLDGHAPDDAGLRRRLALIGGTSSCHMAVSPDPSFVPGVWGPSRSAMVPGLWLNEGGQSATGALVDHVIMTHAAYGDLRERAGAGGVHEALNQQLDLMAGGGPVASLTRDLHVLPYHHGDRSPRADPTLRGVVSGLRLSATIEDLALLYLATVQAIAYGTRHIIETLNAHGYAIDTILASGGGTKNRVFLQSHADATRCRVVLAAEPEAVLLGAAVLGAVAGGAYPDVRAAMGAMTRAGRIIEPQADVGAFHDAKYGVFQRMYDDYIAYRRLMAG